MSSPLGALLSGTVRPLGRRTVPAVFDLPQGRRDSINGSFHGSTLPGAGDAALKDLEGFGFGADLAGIGTLEMRCGPPLWAALQDSNEDD